MDGLGEFISKFTHKKMPYFDEQGEKFGLVDVVAAQIPGSAACDVYWHTLRCVCHTCNCDHSVLLRGTKLSIDQRK